MSQKTRVLAALRMQGARGVTAVDFLLPDIIDGGKPITRVAARVLELREDGHDIRMEGIRHGCAVYRLMRDLQDQPAQVPAPAREDDALFTPQPRLAIFDEDAA